MNRNRIFAVIILSMLVSLGLSDTIEPYKEEKFYKQDSKCGRVNTIGPLGTRGNGGSGSLPISTRPFKIGMGPFPKNLPNSTGEDLDEAFEMAGLWGELSNYWPLVPWYEEEEKLFDNATTEFIIDALYTANNITPVFQTNFWDVFNKPGYGMGPWLVVPPELDSNTSMGDPELRLRWVNHVKNITQEWQPEYYCLGNEINSFHNWHPENGRDFTENLTTLVYESYQAIKEVSPNTTVLITFRLLELYSENNFELLSLFNSSMVDVIAFTSYPSRTGWYLTPSDMPNDYYTKITNYTSYMPIAFAELGWTSNSSFGGNESEQAEFLLWFLNHTKDIPCEYVQWFTLHDLASEENITSHPETVGLRRHDGTPKPIWDYWMELFNLTYTGDWERIPRGPIRINNNMDFTVTNGVRRGNGTEGNPYVIERWDVNGSGYGYCMYIGNTTVFFEVRDCDLHEANGVGSDPYYSDSSLILYTIQNGTIVNNIASNNEGGLILVFSSHNNIINNSALSNNDYSIHLSYSSNNKITRNNASSNNYHGIYLYGSNNNSMTKNTISNNNDGISIQDSNGNTITNNTIPNNIDGIYLEDSIINIINNNEMVKGGIYIEGNLLEHWNSHIIDMTNMVNGKPVLYWKNQTYGTVPSGASQIILANCTNVIIENQKVSSGSVGIELGFSNYNTIACNTASSNTKIGIYLRKSNNNTITANIASSNDFCGINLWSSDGNTITNNNISKNGYGIYLSFSDSNTFTNNSISLNTPYNIWLFSFSLSNKIFHNNIIGNPGHVYEDFSNNNQWDNNYPSGGNFWSDYDGEDNFKGPNQDIPGSDGIGDTPYKDVFLQTLDNYPFMNPVINSFVLYEGWNLISVPLIQQKQNLVNVLNSIEGWYDAIQWYNITDLSNPWKHHNIGKSIGNDLSHLNETMSFWIHITNPGETIFIYNGTAPTSNQTVSLHPGWNMVGYPSLSNHNRTNGLNNLEFGPDVDCIQWYDAATTEWHFMGPDDHFSPGRGYWVHAKVEAGWEVPI